MFDLALKFEAVEVRQKLCVHRCTARLIPEVILSDLRCFVEDTELLAALSRWSLGSDVALIVPLSEIVIDPFVIIRSSRSLLKLYRLDLVLQNRLCNERSCDELIAIVINDIMDKMLIAILIRNRSRNKVTATKRFVNRHVYPVRLQRFPIRSHRQLAVVELQSVWSEDRPGTINRILLILGVPGCDIIVSLKRCPSALVSLRGKAHAIRIVEVALVILTQSRNRNDLVPPALISRVTLNQFLSSALRI